jgi:hypothetical protein
MTQPAMTGWKYAMYAPNPPLEPDNLDSID